MDERLSGTLQENLLALLAHNDAEGKIVARLVEAKEFEGDLRVIAGRCIDYWAKYSCAPAAHMPDILADILEDVQNPKAKTYRHILMGLLHLAPKVNAPYILSRLHDHKREQQLIRAIITTSEMLATKRDLAVGEVENYWNDVLRQTPVEFDAGHSLNDYDEVLSYLKQSQSEFKVGVEQLDEAHVVPLRGGLMVLIAVKGHGKSWFLVNVGVQAWKLRQKVVHISLEMSEAEIMLRYYQTLWSIPLHEAQRRMKVLDMKKGLNKNNEEVMVGKEVMELEMPFTFDSAAIGEELETRLTRNARRASNIRVKRFPPQTLTPNGIRAYLDSLEVTQGFIPDMLIVDYAGLMKSDAKNLRIELGRNVMELRGIGVERNIAVVTAHQASKMGAKAKYVKAIHVAEDWSVVHTADTILTFSATEEEKRLGLGRLFVEHHRNQRDHWGVVMTQALPMGKFVLKSARLPDNYWELIGEAEQDNTGDADPDDDS